MAPGNMELCTVNERVGILADILAARGGRIVKPSSAVSWGGDDDDGWNALKGVDSLFDFSGSVSSGEFYVVYLCLE